ncbi:hypothetical protein ACWF94_31920 [Streptomyces sp. NPDC055078]
MGRTGTTRRRALAVTGAAAAGALTGCSGNASGSPGGADGDAARAEKELRRRLAATSGALRDQYDATIAHHPGLAGRLTPLRTSVAAHVTAFGGTVRAAPPVPVAPDPAAALKALAEAERHTADAHTAALAGARPELARLVASVAAAGAVHTYLLAGGGAR